MIPAIPPEAFNLPMEVQFGLTKASQDIDRCEPQQLRELAKELVRQLAVKDNIIKHLATNLAKNGLI